MIVNLGFRRKGIFIFYLESNPNEYYKRIECGVEFTSIGNYRRRSKSRYMGAAAQ